MDRKSPYGERPAGGSNTPGKEKGKGKAKFNHARHLEIRDDTRIISEQEGLRSIASPEAKQRRRNRVQTFVICKSEFWCRNFV